MWARRTAPGTGSLYLRTTLSSSPEGRVACSPLAADGHRVLDLAGGRLQRQLGDETPVFTSHRDRDEFFVRRVSPVGDHGGCVSAGVGNGHGRRLGRDSAAHEAIGVGLTGEHESAAFVVGGSGEALVDHRGAHQHNGEDPDRNIQPQGCGTVALIACGHEFSRIVVARAGLPAPSSDAVSVATSYLRRMFRVGQSSGFNHHGNQQKPIEWP